MQKKINQKITIDLNYYSLIDIRKIKFISSKVGIIADLIKNEVIIYEKNKIRKIKFNYKFDNMKA